MNNLHELIADIKIHLESNTTIRGFSRDRLEELVTMKFENVHSYEWIFLLTWSGLYVFEFEKKYGVTITDQ